MEKIGEGYWYNVFDLGNERVLKMQKGILQKIKDSYLKESKNPSLWIKTVWNLLCDVSEISSNYNFIKKRVNLRVLGFPNFLKGINYEQDKVKVLADVFIYSSDEGNKKIIDLYIDNILECWRNGFADKTYNFTINNGLNAAGDVILIDFNEITLSKEDALNRVNAKRWKNSWSLTQISECVKDYYLTQMDIRVNSISLQENWCKYIAC